MTTKYSGKTRVESDLIGEMEVPVEALYGVQTLRGIENFPISRFHLSDYPLFINGLAMTKLAAAQANLPANTAIHSAVTFLFRLFQFAAIDRHKTKHTIPPVSLG